MTKDIEDQLVDLCLLCRIEHGFCNYAVRADETECWIYAAVYAEDKPHESN